MSIPIAWHILNGTEPKAISATPEQKERAKKRLAEIDSIKMTWSAVELKMERENLKAIINS